MTVDFTGAAEPLFPWPETARALAEELLGPAGAWNPPAPSGRTVVAAPWTLWNEQLIGAFDSAATKLPARLTIARNAMTEFTATLGGPPLTADGAARAYDVFIVDKAGPTSLETLRATAHETRLTLNVTTERIRTAGCGPAPHVVELPQSSALVAHVTRWPHLLWLMQMAAFSRRAQALGDVRARGPGNVLGQRVKIHSTALVEQSVLMDGVEVDAHATVMGSVLGPGVRVADHTAIHHCVLGTNCNTLADSFLRRVVGLPESTISNVDLREVLLGRRVFITSGVIFFTGNHGTHAPVGQHPDALEDSGHPELGGAVGHQCVLGTRALFEPGRAVPGGIVIVMRPEEGVLQMPEHLPPGTLTAWDKAALTSVAVRWPGHRFPEVD